MIKVSPQALQQLYIINMCSHETQVCNGYSAVCTVAIIGLHSGPVLLVPVCLHLSPIF